MAGPVAGIDYPRTFEEFDRFFPDEDACRRYLTRVRWRAGFSCGGCGCGDSPWVTARGYYLDEYTFRFNRRSSRARGLLFHRLMEQAATTGPTRYRDLVGGNHNG